MADDTEFEPRLGRIGARGSRGGRKYLHRVLQAAALAGTARAGPGRFHGSRIGRGAGAGRVLAERRAMGGGRRAVVKARLVRLGGRGIEAARAHLRYVQRDGVSRTGESGRLYGAERDIEDGKAFLERATGDRHQFRFIVSAEDGAEYADLKPLARRLMARMEEDLGTGLDWVAVDHFNTGHPHSHILLRGIDDRGKDLIIARDYLSSGMRARAAEIVELDLGPKSDLEIRRRLLREMEQERWTSLDRRLCLSAGADGHARARAGSPVLQTALAGRLAKLERLGLAERDGSGRWRLADDLEAVLRRMGERGDILRTMHREMVRRAMPPADRDLAIFDPRDQSAPPLVGRLVSRGLSDELRDRHYLIVEATDGRTHYVDIGRGDVLEPLPEGAIVRVAPRPVRLRAADRTVADVAAANGGRYTIDLHLRHDPGATQAFAETHVRRLEAMRRRVGQVEREADGTWRIARDHLDLAVAFEERQRRDRPVSVEILSRLPIERQIGMDGATWLDRELVSAEPAMLREAGFGAAVRDAGRRRLGWLVAEGLAAEGERGAVFRPDMIDTLRRRELLRVAGQLAGELGLDFAEALPGDRVEGVLRRPVDLASGRYALVEKSRAFTLVPWRPVLERQLGRRVSGIMRDAGPSWHFGQGRGPTID